MSITISNTLTPIENILKLLNTAIKVSTPEASDITSTQVQLTNPTSVSTDTHNTELRINPSETDGISRPIIFEYNRLDISQIATTKQVTELPTESFNEEFLKEQAFTSLQLDTFKDEFDVSSSESGKTLTISAKETSLLFIGQLILPVNIPEGPQG